MKQLIVIKRLLIAAFLTVVLLGQSVPAYARHASGRGPAHRKYVKEVKRLPRGHYSYHGGGFYRRGGFGLWVTFPIGKVILKLPVGYCKVIVQGRPYYFYEGIYYAHSPRGYVVVSPPDVYCVEEIKDTVIIHIPNANGSYTAVELKKSGEGYIGPQGEYYPEHPTVEQLLVLYGK
jgi:hypothetical protein